MNTGVSSYRIYSDYFSVSASRGCNDAYLQQIKDDNGLQKQAGAETKKP
jgi:hypothetical protein